MHGAVNVIQAPPAERPQRVSLEGGPDEFYRAPAAARALGRSHRVGGTVIATHDGGWRDNSGLDEQKLNLHCRAAGRQSTLGVRSPRPISTRRRRDSSGLRLLPRRGIAKPTRIPRPIATPRDAPDRQIEGQARLGQLEFRPYVRHSRMDFLQHFLIGKPLEENGQEPSAC